MKFFIVFLSLFMSVSLLSGNKLPKRKLSNIRKDYSAVNSQAERLLKSSKVYPPRSLTSVTNSIDIVLNDKFDGPLHSTSYATAVQNIIDKHFPMNRRTGTRLHGVTFAYCVPSTVSVVSNDVLEKLFQLYVKEYINAINSSDNSINAKASKLFDRGSKRIKLQKDSGIQSFTIVNDRVDIIQSAFKLLATKLKNQTVRRANTGHQIIKKKKSIQRPIRQQEKVQDENEKPIKGEVTQTPQKKIKKANGWYCPKCGHFYGEYNPWQCEHCDHKGMKYHVND